MEEEKQKISITNNFAEGSNCQVFNGDITNSVFAMPGSTVNQYAGQASANNNDAGTSTNHPSPRKHELEEELFCFIHPAIEEEEQWKIHYEVKRLVKRQGVQEICMYLQQMSREKRILLPSSPGKVYAELVRLGMPSGEGFNEKTFQKYYCK